MTGITHTTLLAFPVSVKGVVLRGDRVLLLRNDRAEWELPGGRIELRETPEECVTREIREETGWNVTTSHILDAWMYHIAAAEKNVFIVTYGCHLDADADPVLSTEHNDIGLFTEEEVDTLTMPSGYKRSVHTWYQLLNR